MRAELALSKTLTQCVSRDRGWDYDNIVITVPEEMCGAVFEGVKVAYGESGAEGAGSIRFSDTRALLSESALLERLNAGETRISLLFSFRGFSGGEARHYWTGFSVTCDYLPAGGARFSPAPGVMCAFGTDGIAAGESCAVSLDITAPSDINGAALELEPGGRLEFDIALSAGGRKTVSGIFSPGADELDERAVPVRARLILLHSGGETEYPPVETGLTMLAHRLPPEISVCMTPGVIVQGHTSIDIEAQIQRDYGAAIAERRFTLGGNEYPMAGDAISGIDTGGFSGDVPWELEVRDSYGLSASASGMIRVEPYTQPVISDVSVERYAPRISAGGGTEYVQDEGGARVRLTFSGGVCCLPGENPWRLLADGRAILTGENGGEIALENDRDALDGEFDPGSEHTVIITLADGYSSVSRAVTVPAAGGIFNIERGGVAVGRRASGTVFQPRFECAYPAYFEAGVFDGGGNSISGQCFEEGTRRIGTFMGKALYRTGLMVSALSTDSSNPSTVDTGVRPGCVVGLSGFVKTRGFGNLPVNCYHSGSLRAFLRPDGGTGRLIGYCACPNDGAVIFMDYTEGD